MASTGTVFSSCFYDALRGNINFETDIFRVMLVGAGYKLDRTGHTRRKDVIGEIVADGYKAGGAVAKVSLRKEGDLLVISLGAAQWQGTITARGAVYFKGRNGEAGNEELVGHIDFGRDVASTDDAFKLAASSIQFQN